MSLQTTKIYLDILKEEGFKIDDLQTSEILTILSEKFNYFCSEDEVNRAKSVDSDFEIRTKLAGISY